jgi:hypothetical protein
VLVCVHVDRPHCTAGAADGQFRAPIGRTEEDPLLPTGPPRLAHCMRVGQRLRTYLPVRADPPCSLYLPNAVLSGSSEVATVGSSLTGHHV